MVQSSQPSEHVEDPMGLQRPTDKDPEQDLDGLSESLSDLNEARLVSSPGTPREVLHGDDPLQNSTRAVTVPLAVAGAGIAYPEWDYRIAAYRERAVTVRPAPAREGPESWVREVYTRNRHTLNSIRRRFEALRSRRAVDPAQPEGDELDLAAVVNAFGDRRAKLPRADRVYLLHRPARLDLALMILIDVSGSTEAWIAGERRVIDIEKEALVVVSYALDALRLDCAVYGFTGHGPHDVRIAEVKRFGSRFDESAARRVAGLEPGEYTRAGAAVRHCMSLLARTPAHRRLLLLLSDGKPNDCDHYEGRYGIEDLRQAIAEARLHGVTPFCVTIDRHEAQHLPRLFGHGNYTIVPDPARLASALLEWLRQVTRYST
jgi:nitric oxide reductase NorD protein